MIPAQIVEHEKCCMCYACVNICPKHCIVPVKEKNGEIHPYIDEANCIKCGLCQRICPSNKLVEAYVPKHVYAACSKYTDVHNNSTSGGIARELSDYILSCDGIVYGTVLFGTEAQVRRITSDKELKQLTGSKYLHSHMKGALSNIKRDVLSGRTVLVIGTPCQIAAVKQFVSKEYNNLYLVDILCHGAPSQDCFANGLALETNDEADNITFRTGATYELTITTKNSKVIKVPYRICYWLNGFLEGMLFRENCYSCPYAKESRVGDITLGDFWGLDASSKLYDKRHQGINVVLVNSDKGSQLFRAIKNKIEIEERTLEEAKKANHSLSNPANKPKRYDRFKSIYESRGGKTAILTYDRKKTLFIRIRKIIRSHSILYGMISRLPYLGRRI